YSGPRRGSTGIETRSGWASSRPPLARHLPSRRPAAYIIRVARHGAAIGQAQRIGPARDRRYSVALIRRGGRVAEGARLESVYTGNRIEGSNPSPSARLH